MKKIMIIITVLLYSFSHALLAADALDKILNKQLATQYVCQTCPHVHDISAIEVFEHDGKCPVCGMNLIEKQQPIFKINTTLHHGSGNYFIKAGLSHPNKLINVFYHQPKNFNPQSKILLVIPGAGRNAWSYRDSWITASEKYNVLIISPAYAEQDYDFAAYHMGGVIANLEFKNVEAMKQGKRLKKYRLKDQDIVFDLNPDTSQWLFNDFDRIFDHVVNATGSLQTNYDIFGHSAGGQILHRLAIFKPNSKADRILASNSGSYTLPTSQNSLPFGIADTAIDTTALVDTFATTLVLLIGENDNAQETRGTMLHTPIVDQQGLGRLSRAKYFFNQAQITARQINTQFNWHIEIVKDVGHNYTKMGQAAAHYLYEK